MIAGLRAGRFLPAGLFVAIGVLLYGFTLPFPFQFDDFIYFVRNPLATDPRSFLFPLEFHDFANRAKGLGLDPDLSTNIILRPIAYLTFYVNHLLGGMNPPGYRAVNIAIHCANAGLLYELLRRLFRGAPDSARFVAMTAALLFLVHPLQTESVTYVIQRFTSLGTFFYLFTVLMFVVARTAEDAAVARRCRRWSVAGLFVGLFVKEFIFTAPFMMVLLDWLVLGSPLRAAGRRMLPWAVLLPIVPVLIVLTSAAQSEGGATFGAALNVAGPKDVAADFPRNYALTQPSVVLSYLRLILLPRGLTIDPDPPVVTSWREWRFLGSLALIAAIVGAAKLWYRRDPADARRAVGCAFVLWYFLTLACDSSIVPLPDLMSEHRSYLPSIGIVTALACLADLVRTRWLGRRHLRLLVPAGVGAWVFALSVATVERNQVWRSAVAMWADAAEKSPNKVRVWANLAQAYGEEGLLSRSMECSRRAIALQPTFVAAYCNLATAENLSGRFREAVAVAEEGLRRVPDHHALHFVIGISYLNLGEYRKSLEAMARSAAHNPASVQAHLGMAEMHARLGEYDAFLKCRETALSLGLRNEPDREQLRQIEAFVAARRGPP